MKYLSCKAESAILTSSSTNTTKKTNNKNKSSTNNSQDEIQQFLYTDLEVATNGFSDQKLLGRGSHGCVYKGVLRSGRLVAVKKPSSTTNNQVVDNEIHILSKIRSPGLVNLVGYSTNSLHHPLPLLVVEFMSNGTLYDLLHSRPKPLNWVRRIRLCLQIAKAVHTLHSSNPPVIHRDIKSANVLIDTHFNARLGDFGLALQCGHGFRSISSASTPPAGTIGYLDPGYVTPDNLSTKIDVFSFGILILEMISGRKAIDVGYSPPSILDWAVPLIRKGKVLAIYDPRIAPPKDPSLRKQLAVLAAKCVRSTRERRPSMMNVIDSLTVLSDMISSESHTWINNPCMMVEQVGAHYIESPNFARNLSSKVTRRTQEGESSRDMGNPRRVYSNLSVRRKNNLMDLMAETETETETETKTDNVVLDRAGSERVVGIRVRESLPFSRDNVFNLRRNQSMGGEKFWSSNRDGFGGFNGAAICIKADVV